MSNHVIVVLGYHEHGADGSHGISPICRAGVRRAAALAAQAPPRAVIFTGWSSTGGPSEAEQMAAIWDGPGEVTLLCEPQAANTAENAVRTLELLQALDGASEVTVVCSVRHFPRARFFFQRLYRSHGIAVRYRYVASPLPSARLLAAELSSLTRMVGDRRTALRLLPPSLQAVESPAAHGAEPDGVPA